MILVSRLGSNSNYWELWDARIVHYCDYWKASKTKLAYPSCARTTPTRPKGAPQHQKIVKSLNSIEFEECFFCGKTSDSIEFLPHRTVAQSMSATCYCSQSASRPNCCPIYVSRMPLLAECTPPNLCLITSAACS